MRATHHSHTPTVASCAVLSIVLATGALFGQSIPERPGGTRPTALTKPRVPPVAESQWTAEQKQLVAKYVPEGSAGNGVETLLHIPPLVDGTMPFLNYISRESSLSPRHRELLILRTGSLLQRLRVVAACSDRAQGGVDVRGDPPNRARPRRAGLGDVRRHAPATGRSAVQKLLSDERHVEPAGGSYDMYHLMDAVMTVADITSVGLLYSSLGVQRTRAVRIGFRATCNTRSRCPRASRH